LLRDLAGDRLAEMEHAGQVHGDDAVPGLGVEVEEIAAMADPGAVEQNIEPAKLPDHALDGGIDRGAVAHIEAERGGAPAAVADAPGAGFGRGRIDIGAEHRRAFSRQCLGAGPANAAAGAGHQRHLALDPAHAALLSFPGAL
jgi:hypothetical protein